MKLGYRQGLVSAVLFVVMLVVLMSIDERVRERFSALAASGGTDVAPLGHRITEFGGAMITAMRYQSIDGAPLLIFAAGSAVLVLFMLRT